MFFDLRSLGVYCPLINIYVLFIVANFDTFRCFYNVPLQLLLSHHFGLNELLEVALEKGLMHGSEMSELQTCHRHKLRRPPKMVPWVQLGHLT
jgi:hypothetical protein